MGTTCHIIYQIAGYKCAVCSNISVVIDCLDLSKEHMKLFFLTLNSSQ